MHPITHDPHVYMNSENSQKMDYPGKSAHFVLDPKKWIFSKKGNWEYHAEDFDLVRCLEFCSATEDSLFNRCAILGNKDGSVRIMVGFQTRHAQTIIAYFKKNHLCEHIEFQTYEGVCGYKTQSNEENKNLIKILMEHNQFPEEYLSLVCEMMEKGDWISVTPTTTNEKDPIGNTQVIFVEVNSILIEQVKHELLLNETRMIHLNRILDFRIPKQHIEKMIDKLIKEFINELKVEGISQKEYSEIHHSEQLTKQLQQQEQLIHKLQTYLTPILSDKAKDFMYKAYEIALRSLSNKDLVVVIQFNRFIQDFFSIKGAKNMEDMVAIHDTLKKFKDLVVFADSQIQWDQLYKFLYSIMIFYRNTGQLFKFIQSDEKLENVTKRRKY
jgi:hypothetical protein